MVPWAAASAPSAPNSASVTAWLTSTFPATTAAGYSGDSIDRGGMTILIGRRQPAFIGGDLGFEIVDVLERIARRVFGAGEERIELRLAEMAAIHHFEIVDIDAFLLDGPGVGRHRAGRDAAHVGVVAAACHPKQDLPLSVIENRRANRNVRKVGAAVVRRVDHVDVARPNAACVFPDDGLDSAVHGAEAHRHVLRISAEGAVMDELIAG